MLGSDYPGTQCIIPQELNHQLHSCKKTEDRHTSFLSPDNVQKSRQNFGAPEDAIFSGVPRPAVKETPCIYQTAWSDTSRKY